MFNYGYKTDNTCFQVISPEINGDTDHNVSFIGGSNENWKAIPILIGDWTVKQI